MSTVDPSVWEVHLLLTDLALPYAIIGGTAVQYWGELRFTRDLDLTVLAPIESFPETVHLLLSRLNPRISNALEFACVTAFYLLRRPAAIKFQSL